MPLHSPAYYLDCIDQGIHLYWRTLGKMRHMQTHMGDIEYVRTDPPGGPERVYRIRLSPETAEQRVDEIIAGILVGDIPNGLLLGPNTTPPDLAAILVRKGFTLNTAAGSFTAAPCMALDLVDFYDAAPLPAGVQVIPVTGEQQLRHCTRIVNLGLFGCELMSFEQFTDLYRLDNTRFFLAYEDVSPASTAMTICDGPIATLEFVATLPDHRRKGLGTAVTAAALRDLQQRAITTVTLRAEPDGINIYQKVGFQTFCQRVVATYNA